MGNDRPLGVWVLAAAIGEALFERLGDARAVADRLAVGVGLLLAGPYDADPAELFPRGADHISRVHTSAGARGALIAAARQVLGAHSPRLVLGEGDVHGREWAAGLAAAMGWLLVSPALMVQARATTLEVTALDRSGRRARSIRLDATTPAVLTLRPGVGEAIAPDPSRQGTFDRVLLSQTPPEAATLERTVPADPATVDIRLANRLVSGGRGLGSKEGFDMLRRFAAHLGAGVAASRMAVDLGWIEHARQVGQTGKTVKPDLYIACGISGASHHLEGMSDAKHIIAINTDPEAPIFKLAHLGLVADLYQTLQKAEEGLKP